MFQLADTAENSTIDMDYHIQVVTKDDKLRILKFLRRFFFRDEPLNQSIELIPEGEGSTCLELEEYCSMSALENNLSLMAVSTSGTIIGVLLNGKNSTTVSKLDHCPFLFVGLFMRKMLELFSVCATSDIQI